MMERSEPGDEKALSEAKAALRREVLKRRALAHATHGPESAGRLARLGLPLILALPGRHISAYLPIRDELDVLPLIAALIDAGRTIALPVIEARGAPLVFRSWRPGEPLEARPFGLREPPLSAPAVLPDVLLVPLAAFDRAGYRLGYGGGYYDRTLALYRPARRVVAIGIAYDEQEVEALPLGPHDQKLDMILTPSGVRRPGG